MSVPRWHTNVAPLVPGGSVRTDPGAPPQDAILQSLDDGLIMTGLDGRVTFHNHAAARLLDLTDAPLTGACLREVLLLAGIRLALSPRQTSTHVMSAVNGRRRTLRVRTFRVRDTKGATVGVGHLVEDITRPHRVLRRRDLELDTESMRVSLRGRRLVLTRTELRLLQYFMDNAGTTLRHARILRHVWGPKYRDEAHYVRVYVNRLRRKIEADPARPTYLITERGVGYRFTG